MLARKDPKVRFVRIRGRIVPIRAKGASVSKRVQKARNVRSAALGGIALGAAGVGFLLAGPSIGKGLLRLGKVATKSGKSFAPKVASELRVRKTAFEYGLPTSQVKRIIGGKATAGDIMKASINVAFGRQNLKSKLRNVFK